MIFKSIVIIRLIYLIYWRGFGYIYCIEIVRYNTGNNRTIITRKREKKKERKKKGPPSSMVSSSDNLRSLRALACELFVPALICPCKSEKKGSSLSILSDNSYCCYSSFFCFDAFLEPSSLQLLA